MEPTMKLFILAVGNKMPEWITSGFNEYTKRMPREATIALVEIKPEPRTTGKTVAQIMEAEAQRIESSLPKDVTRIVLDERGAHLTTKQLSQKMHDWLGRRARCRFHHWRCRWTARIRTQQRTPINGFIRTDASPWHGAGVTRRTVVSRIQLVAQSPLSSRIEIYFHEHQTSTHLPCLAKSAQARIAQADWREL
jgi:hypothetical protein